MGARTSRTLLHAWFPSQSTGAAGRADGRGTGRACILHQSRCVASSLSWQP